MLFLKDKNFEEMAFPDKFCYGNGGFSEERLQKLTCRKYGY